MQRTSLIVALILFIFSFVTNAQDNILDEFFNNAVESGRISGVHALVAKDGIPVYSKTFGYADIESDKVLDEDGIYRISSMTKIVTTIAALQLWEQGAFKLDDPVNKYISEFDKVMVLKSDAKNRFEPPFETEPLKRQPTIRDLFRHTAGIWGGLRYTQAGLRNWDGSLEGFVNRLVSVPFDTQPGTRFQYGYCHDIIGYLIEKISGQPLDEYYNEHIFQPLNLHDTGFVISEKNLSRLVSHYDLKEDKLVCYETADSSPFRTRSNALSGGGGWNYSCPGLLTSMNDWLVIMEAIRNHGIYNNTRILKESTVKLMCTDQLGEIPGAFEAGTGYGLGIGVVTDSEKHGKGVSDGTVYWAGAPHNTYFYIDREKGISAAMMMQSGPFGMDNMMNDFLIKSQKVYGTFVK